MLVLGAGLAGVTRAVGAGVADGRTVDGGGVAGRGVAGTAVGEPAGCAGVWETAALGGLKYK